MTWTLQPVWSPWMVVLALAVLAVALAAGTAIMRARNTPRRWVWRLAALRAAAFALLLLGLLRPRAEFERAAEEPPDRVVLVDTSASMGQADAGAAGTRMDEAVRVLRDAGFSRAVLEGYRTVWYGFDAHARPLDGGLDRLPAPAGEDTRFAAALEEALGLQRLARGGAGSRPPRVLLVSDGRDLGPEDPLQAARRLGVAVDVLLPAATGAVQAASAAIAAVQGPRRILLGSELRLMATVRQVGLERVPMRLALAEDGQRVAVCDLEFGPGEEERLVSLACQPAAAGLRVYTLTLESDRAALAPTGAPPSRLAVRVESRRHEVLMIETTWRWDFRFLRRVLEDDPSFSFTGFLSRGSGTYMQFGEPERRVNLGGFPQSKAELEAFDTFVLGDVDPRRLPPQLVAALRELVVEDGRSLILIAGPSVEGWARSPELAPLLPVELTRASGTPTEGPVPVRVSLEGEASPFFYAPPGAPSVRRWPDLPPMDRVYAPVRKRPAATILLEAAEHANEYGNLIVAAAQTVGRGQSLFIGTDTLWKWQMLGLADADENTPYRVFWQQALRALKPPRLSGGTVNLWLQPERTRVSQGRPVAVRAEVDAAPLPAGASVQGSVTLPDGRSLPLAFAASAENPAAFGASFEAGRAGTYEIRASVASEGRTLADAAAAVDVDGPPGERTPLPPNPARLRALAAGTGGAVLEPGAPDGWAAAGAPAAQRTVRTETVDLWGGLALIVALTLVLGADWLARLMKGYV